MINNTIPRPEYPRPQLRRDDWLNLNGDWQYEFDFGMSGRERGLQSAEKLGGSIVVPFCPESKLSGLAHTDFINCIWYRRSFELPKGWSEGRVLLHFGAVDYSAEAYVNGKSAGKHRGGYTSFEFDVTALLHGGENVVTLCAEDDVKYGNQPAGKQSAAYGSHGCHYTRNTGIWQTVWLEHVPEVYIANVLLTPDVKNEKLHAELRLGGTFGANGYRVKLSASYAGKPVAEAEAAAGWNGTKVELSIPKPELWEPGCGRLYDLRLSLIKNGAEVDSAVSYFGMRDVDVTDKAILINGKPVFQRLILDQGFYPDGIYTAPTDGELKADIERSMAMGYNGARLHQKIFEPRFLYWADKLGYLCWSEHASWGINYADKSSLFNFLPEYTESVMRDYSHPAIVGWCPFNETNRQQNPFLLRFVYEAVKALDSTRPVIDSSGYVHVVTDIFDVHDYEQSPAKLAENENPAAEGGLPYMNTNYPETYTTDRPYFVSEFGGIRWADETAPGWGYGNAPKSAEEFVERYRGLCGALLDNPRMCAFCYTQLTDVEQELNGLYTYDRRAKFAPELIAPITSRRAAIEKI